MREAADVELVASRETAEQMVRERVGRVDVLTGAQGSKVFLAATGPGIWTGVVVTESSVPVHGVRVWWSSADKQTRQALTDRRGVFVVGETGHRAVSIRAEHPISIERSLE